MERDSAGNVRSSLELDCSRVRTSEELAGWAIEAFDLPVSVADLPTFPVRGLLFTRQELSMDALTDRIYHHLGKSRLSFTVKLKNYLSASKTLRRALLARSGCEAVLRKPPVGKYALLRTPTS